MKTIATKKWYTPRQIARLGLIKNTMNSDKLESNYKFILGLIHSKQLRAKHVGIGTKRPTWLVPESEIMRYHDTVTKV